MRKTFKTLVILILIIFIFSIMDVKVIANSNSFKIGLSSSNNKIAAGDEIEISLRIYDINAGTNGIGALKFKFNYDTNVFEKITKTNITYKNKWDDVTYSDKNSIVIFLQSSSPYTTKDEEVCTIKLKAKNNLQGENTKISFTEIEGSNYDTTIKAENVETSLTIEKNSKEDDKTVQVTSINLKGSTTIEKGKTEKLVATVNPNNATNKNLIWSSSNTNVATVSNGVVTGVSTGKTTITVTSVSNSNVTANCMVTVVDNANPNNQDNTTNPEDNSDNTNNEDNNNNNNNNNNKDNANPGNNSYYDNEDSTDSRNNNSTQNSNNKSNIEQEDEPSGNLPKAGKKNTILLICAVLAFMSIFFYIKIRSLKF